MSMVEIEFDILSTLNEDKQAFLSFRFFVDVLKQLWSEGDVPLKISDQIKKVGTDLSADLYVNSTQLILEIDRLIHQFNSSSLFKASSYLRFINQQIECSIQKTYPSAITVYRVQLVSDRDLKAMIKNKDNLIIMHTIVLASRSFSSVKSICRRACDNGLTAVLFEINIPKMTPLTYLDSDIIIFPMSTIFKIKSINSAPDTICHIQMELADSIMELMQAQISSTIGECLSWLTFGSYLAHIKQYDAAGKYFKYLLSISPNTQQHASILTNISLMYLSMNGKDHEALDCLNTAANLVQSYQEKINEQTTEHTEEHSILDNKTSQYDKFAELHRKTGDPVYARLFYEKALKCTSDPTLLNNTVLDNNLSTAMVISHSESLPDLPATFPTGNTTAPSVSLQHDYAEALIHDSIVIWYYDENLPSNIWRAMQVKLNQSFKHVNTFTDETMFLNYLDNLSDVLNRQFIISGRRAEQLCAYIENSSAKYDVYEFDITHTQPTRRTSSGTWLTFGMVDELFNTLLEKLQRPDGIVGRNEGRLHESECKSRLLCQPPLNVFNLSSIPTSFHSLDKEPSTFLLFQLLCKTIIRMEYTDEELEIMCVFCRENYQCNDTQMENITRFQRGYRRDEAIEYYTKHTFLFKPLTEVFQREHTSGIYKFRRFIADLHKKLEEQKCTYSEEEMVLYRGKKIPLIVLQQLKDLKKQMGEEDVFISMSGFLSTTKDKTVAEHFAAVGEEREGYESTIFKLRIPEAIRSNICYADITGISCNPDEREVLFSVNLVWKFLEIVKENDRWTIELELSDQFAKQLTELDTKLSNEHSFFREPFDNDYYIFLLAKILYKLGRYSLSEEFYNCLLEKEDLPDGFECLIYLNLATMLEEQGHIPSALKHLEQALATYKSETTSPQPTHVITTKPSQLTILNAMGLLYYKRDKYNQARNSFINALRQSGSSSEKARVYYNLGILGKRVGSDINEICDHFRKAVELAENSIWSNQIKQDLENVERQLNEK